MKIDEPIKEGWAWLINSTKWHYFVDGRSLCGKYAVVGDPELEQGNDDRPDNCKACMRGLERRRRYLGKGE